MSKLALFYPEADAALHLLSVTNLKIAEPEFVWVYVLKYLAFLENPMVYFHEYFQPNLTEKKYCRNGKAI